MRQNKPQSWTTTITFAATGAVVLAFISSRQEGISNQELLLTGVVSFAMLALSIRVSDRMTRAILGRYGPKAPPPRETPVLEATTERPSHVARRRQQRRPRGGPRKR